MSEVRVAGPSTVDMSAAPAALEGSSSAEENGMEGGSGKKTMSHTRENYHLVMRGEFLFHFFGGKGKGKSHGQPMDQEMALHQASKDAIQRSRLAQESTEQREKEEEERAQRAAERRLSRESQRRDRAESSASANLRRRLVPRRFSNRLNPPAPQRRPPTFDQAIRYGQQHGHGVERVAEEFGSRSNSVANMATLHEVAAQQPETPVAVKKARSAHQLMPVETATTGASSITMVPADAAKTENPIRATKSAADLRDKNVVVMGEEEKADSGTGGSTGTNSMDSTRKMGASVLGLRKKVSVASSLYSRPETGVVVDASGGEVVENQWEGVVRDGTSVA